MENRLIAARRGHSDIAVGNVFGSNIFNALLCLGAATLAGAVDASLRSLWVELLALMVMTALAVVFLRSQRTISRVEGGILMACFALFMIVTV